MYIGLIDQLNKGSCDRAYNKFINTVRTEMRFHSDRYPDPNKSINDLIRTANEIDSLLELPQSDQIHNELTVYISLVQPLINEYESDFQGIIEPSRMGFVMRPSIGNTAISLGLFFRFYRNEQYESAVALLSELTSEWTVYYEWLRQKRGKKRIAKKGGYKKAENYLDENKAIYDEVRREFATGKYKKGGKGAKSLSNLAKIIYGRSVNIGEDKDENKINKLAESTILGFARKLANGEIK